MNPLRQLSSSRHAFWLTHFVGVVGLVCIALPIYYFSWQPTLERKDANLALAVKLQDQLSDADDIRQEFRLLTEAHGNVNFVEAIRHDIPDNPRDARFLGEVSSIASEMGIKIDDFQRGQVTECRLFSRLSISVRFNANYVDICQFFKRVSELSYLARITQLEIKADIGSTDYAVVARFELCFQPDQDAHSSAIALSQ